MNQQKANFVRAFLHGITGAGLFRRLNYPGAPTELVDPRPIEEILASGVLGETIGIRLKEDQERQQSQKAIDEKAPGSQAER